MSWLKTLILLICMYFSVLSLNLWFYKLNPSFTSAWMEYFIILRLNERNV